MTQKERAKECADRETGYQITKPSLVHVINVSRHIRHQPHRQGEGRKVSEKCERDERKQNRRVPCVRHSLLEVAPRRLALKLLRCHRDVNVPAQRLGVAEHQERADGIERRDDHVGWRHSEQRHDACARERASHACRILRGARHREPAHQRIVGHAFGDQRATHTKVGGPHETHHQCDDNHHAGADVTGENESEQRRGEHRIGRAHREQERLVAEPVTGDAIKRRDQSAEILRSTEQREPNDRFRLDQYVPAKDDRLHLERPRGEQIGRPLETKAAHPERGQHGRARARRRRRGDLRLLERIPGPVEHFQRWFPACPRRAEPTLDDCDCLARLIAHGRCAKLHHIRFSSRSTSTAMRCASFAAGMPQ